MNKISDLKAGDYIITYHFGKVKVKSIRIHDIYMDKVIIERCGIEYPFNDFGIDWEKTNELNNKQMEFKIEVPQGFEIDKDKSTFEKIVFKEIQNKLPMSVEEIPNRKWYISLSGDIRQTSSMEDKNNLSTKERAEAFLALMQLVELRDKWNGDSERHQFLIAVRGGDSHSELISFKNSELRNKFEKQFKDLIEQAKELL